MYMRRSIQDNPLSEFRTMLHLLTSGKQQKMKTLYDQDRPDLGFAILSLQRAGDPRCLPVAETIKEWSGFCYYYYGSVIVGDNGIAAFQMLDETFVGLSTLEQLRRLLELYQYHSPEGLDTNAAHLETREIDGGIVEVDVIQVSSWRRRADTPVRTSRKVIGQFDFNPKTGILSA
jgi:hypothetical protein